MGKSKDYDNRKRKSCNACLPFFCIVIFLICCQFLGFFFIAIGSRMPPDYKHITLDFFMFRMKHLKLMLECIQSKKNAVDICFYLSALVFLFGFSPLKNKFICFFMLRIQGKKFNGYAMERMGKKARKKEKTSAYEYC